jgi:hypothetical protein
MSIQTAVSASVVDSSIITNSTLTNASKFPTNVENQFKFVLNQYGDAYAVTTDEHKNCLAYAIGGKSFNNIIQRCTFESGKILKRTEIEDINAVLTARAEMSGEVLQIHSRVAPGSKGGIVIDLVDVENTRLEICDGEVKIIKDGSAIPFSRTVSARPMLYSKTHGDINLLKKYINCSDPDFLMLTVFIAYTLAQPKIRSSKFMFLILLGASGFGKSSICDNVIVPLIDNSIVGIQSFPKDEQALGISTQNSHISCFDNVRDLSTSMSDALCKLSTGNSFVSRKLYSNDDQHITRLHSAVVINGVSSFVTEPDLAQRCLTIELKPMVNASRISDAKMLNDLENDLPIIFRGIVEMIANVFVHLPNVIVKNHERMIEFVNFLSAMEMVDEVPNGIYQGLYSSKLQDAQIDSLFEDPLGVAMMEFCRRQDSWEGLPNDLLASLHQLYKNTKNISGLPTNPSAFSKRLRFISNSLLMHGIKIEFSRTKHRLITIEVLNSFNAD